MAPKIFMVEIVAESARPGGKRVSASARFGRDVTSRLELYHGQKLTKGTLTVLLADVGRPGAPGRANIEALRPHIDEGLVISVTATEVSG